MVYQFVDFRFVIDQWQAVGVFDVLLPLLLVFALVFAILEKSKILGGYKSIDAVVSLIISLFVIANPYVTELFIPIFSKAGLAIIILVAMLIIVGLFMTAEEPSKTLKTIGAIGGIGLFIWLLMAVSDYYTGWPWYYSFKLWWWNNASWVIPIAFVVIGIIIVVATTGGKKEEKTFAPVEVKK